MRFTIADLVQLTGAEVVQWFCREPVRLNHDINRLEPGDLHFPMRRSNVNTALLEALSHKKAAGIVLYSGLTVPSLTQFPDLGVLTMALPQEQFLQLGAEARRRSKGLVIGITGSSGKTSTKEFLASILATRYHVHSTRGSLNFVHDCAHVLMGLENTPDQAAVIEMAFGAIGNIDKMAEISVPWAGVITKVTADHLDACGESLETMIAEKARLGHRLPPDGVLVIHAEDPGCSRLVRSDFPCRVLTFGEGNGADLRYGIVEADETGTTVSLRLFGKPVTVRLQVCGPFQAANAAAAALVAYALEVPTTDIIQGLEQVRPLPQRFQVHRFDKGLTVVNDTFSSNPDNAITGLKDAAAIAGSRCRMAVLSGITMLGSQRDHYLRKIGRTAVENGFSTLFLIRFDGLSEIRAGALEAGLAPSQIHEVDRDFAHLVEAHIKPNSLLYCKGSMYLNLHPTMEHLLASLQAAGFSPLQPGELASPPGEPSC